MGLRNVSKGAVIASMMLSLPAYSAAAAPVGASQPFSSTVAAAPVSDVRAGAALQGESALGGRRCDVDRDGVYEACGGGFLIPLLALGAVILGILVLIDDDEDAISV